MILSQLTSFFKNDLAALKVFEKTGSVWAQEIAASIAAYTRELDVDEAIGAVQKARRLIRIFQAELENSSNFREKLEEAPLFDWKEFQQPPAPQHLQKRLADMLYIVRGKSDVPIFEVGDQSRYITAALMTRAIADGVDFDINVDDVNFTSVLFEAACEAGIEALAAQTVQARAPVNVRISVHQNLPERTVLDGPEAKQKLYRSFIRPVTDKMRNGQIRWILTSIPTRRDAEVDGIPYEDYTTLYFRMCDQPWDAIKAAQYRLIDTLNAAKILRFTNNDGTDLTMNIDGFTFCNSTVVRNIPGSEVFSAPALDSTEGIIVAKGRFAAKGENGKIMEDLTLRFEKGLLTEARAARGQEHLDAAIGIDEGARRIGEIGIGTNPYLKQHVASILLSEKIGGSFHVALGDAYTMTDYLGDPVRVDNGNRSLLHWDITTMLIGKAGMIYADGAPIMREGLFLDPSLRILNEGWKAIPFEERPPHWQDVYPRQDIVG